MLLLGSGADELFGGYTRHRNAYKRQNWSGLQKELFLDWKRISFRNLARDDRVISDHGRYPRAPYLEESIVDYVLNLKPWLKLVYVTFNFAFKICSTSQPLFSLYVLWQHVPLNL